MTITEKYSNDVSQGAADGSSEANAWSWAQMIAAVNLLGAGGAAGLRVNHKANGGSSRTNNADAITGTGSSTSPFIIRGYKTTPGDGYLGRTNNHWCGGDLITTNMPAITWTTGRFAPTSWTLCESLNLSGAPTVALVAGLSDGAILRCRIANSGTNANSTAISSNVRILVADNDLLFSGASGGAAALVLNSTAAKAFYNRIKGGVANGVNLASSAALIGNCIYGSLVGVAMNATSGVPVIDGNTITANSSDGIDIITGTTGLQGVTRNVISDNGGFGIDGVSAANAILRLFNRFRDNALGDMNSATDWMGLDFGSVLTDTGGPETDYINAAGFDYRLINGSPAQNMIYGGAAGAYQFKGGLMLPAFLNGGLA